jgi:hypothetical protein
MNVFVDALKLNKKIIFIRFLPDRLISILRPIFYRKKNGSFENNIAHT